MRKTFFGTPLRTAATTVSGLSTVAALAYSASCGAYDDCGEMPQQLATFIATNILSTSQATTVASALNPTEVYATTAAALSIGSGILTGAAHKIGQMLWGCNKKDNATITPRDLEDGKGESAHLTSPLAGGTKA